MTIKIQIRRIETKQDNLLFWQYKHKECSEYGRIQTQMVHFLQRQRCTKVFQFLSKTFAILSEILGTNIQPLRI